MVRCISLNFEKLHCSLTQCSENNSLTLHITVPWIQQSEVNTVEAIVCLTSPMAVSAARNPGMRSCIPPIADPGPVKGLYQKHDLMTHHMLYSSSLLSSSSASDFLADFFFFLLLLLGFVSLARGCSKIFRTSSSVIFLSVLYSVKSRAGGAASRWRPFLVIAAKR